MNLSIQKVAGVIAVSAVFLLAPTATAQCPADSLTTSFLAGNGQAGNMFDITPKVDMTIECIDIHSRGGVGTTASFDLYYKVGTSVGSETNPAAWTNLGNYSGPAQSIYQATNVSVAGNGITFLANQTYGIYIDAGAGGRLWYTNGGPTTYSNADLDIVTNCGNADFFGSVFFPREWNGTLYYNKGGVSCKLDISPGTCGVDKQTFSVSPAPAGNYALYWSMSTGSDPYTVGSCSGTSGLGTFGPPKFGGPPFIASGPITKKVPPAVCGSIFAQAVDLTNCCLTNVASP